jgi:hypothetical protein
MQVLSENAVIRINGAYRESRAVLILAQGGKRVVYFDREGKELKREPYSRSRYYKKD